MSRLEKKCFLFSTVLHGLLMAIILFGAAFLSPQRRPDLDLKPLTLVPAKLVDGVSGGGGNPNVRSADEKPKGETLTPQPQASPAVEQKKAEPVLQPPKPTPERKEPKLPLQKPDEDKLPKTSPKNPNRPNDEAKKSTEKPPRVDLSRVVTRKSSSSTAQKSKPETEPQDQAEAAGRAAQKRLAALIGNATSRLKEGFENGTLVEVGGPGGEAYADYSQFVAAVFDDAWIVSESLLDDNSVAVVIVVIARNGDVISKRITKPSRNPTLDKSVQRALDKVKTIGRPFPEGAKESQREFTIEFNLRSKRAFG
jgi:colicin import membrane protein